MDTSFQPRFILDAEVATYGLPSVTNLPTVMNLIDAASTLIDQYCGRIDGTGAGSLVYTTYSERVYVPPARNIIRVSFGPLVGLAQTTIDALASANNTFGNHYYTGCQASIYNTPTGNLSAIVAASGRYGYGRRDQQMTYPDLNYGANILQVASYFGGPPQFTAIDPSAIDYYDQVSEMWLPAGLYLSSYNEVIITYNAGYDPMNLPRGLKHACAALVKAFITRGGGVTNIKGYSAGRIHTQFTEDMIDPAIEKLLRPFAKVNCL